MKNILLIFVMLTGINASAQKVTGFYTGTLVNDTNKMVQSYELALSEYRGKITGYSYVTFITNDTFYYGIRRVKAQIKDDKLIVMDDDFIANNFSEAPAKGVKRMFVYPLNGADSTISLSGKWQTNQTKKYYSIPGNATLARSSDSAHSSLFRHLQELELMTTTASATPEKVVQKELATNKKTEKKAPVEAKPDAKEKLEKPKSPEVKPATVSLPYNQRGKKDAGVVETTADSLLLSFYDNGVIDGDSVSVYVNGVPIILNTKLTATATRKKVAFAGAEMQIVLVAENLGTIPPNTGLVVINDGSNNHQLNFTADLQTNASIVVRKKK